MIKEFRPWGTLDWLLPKLPGGAWSILGVLGTEDRCTATYTSMRGNLQTQKFLKIRDPHLAPEAAFEARFDEIKSRLLADGANEGDIRDVELLQDIDTIMEELEHFLQNSSPRIILDISSMPKRWFFPLIKFLLEKPQVETLVVTYTSALTYGEQLSSDPAALAPIPTFDTPRTRDHYDELVIGVGFAPLGLKDLFESNIGKIRYFFPFPPGPPNFFRNWQFLRTLESEVENRNLRVEDRWQIHMYDVPTAFDALRRVTRDGERTCALAPFGPKTLSLAMCLFAVAAGNASKEPVHIYYTQPRRYALDYTVGIKEVGGVPDIKAYCLRIDGRDLYSL